MTEKELKNKLDKLSYKQNILFGLTCFLRTKHFYKTFEKDNDLSLIHKSIQENFSDFLEKILIDLNTNSDNLKNTFSENLEFSHFAIIDDVFGSSVENFSAQLVAIIASGVLEYGKTKKIEHIEYCIENILEIINQNASDLLYNKFPEKSDDEIESDLDEYYLSELSIQNTIIEMIQKEDTQENIIEFSLKNKLEIC